jgi:hypothetical protein
MLHHARATRIKRNFLFVEASGTPSVEAQLQHQLGSFASYKESDFFKPGNIVVVSRMATKNLASLYALSDASKKYGVQLVFTTSDAEVALILRNSHDAKIYHDMTGTEMLSRDYVDLKLKESLRFHPDRVREIAQCVLDSNSEAALDYVTTKNNESVEQVVREAQSRNADMRDLLWSACYKTFW